MKIIFIFLVFSLTTAFATAGLDITAYENLTMVKSPVLSADGVPVRRIKYFVSERLPGAF
nr:hypothetical protein [Herbaspirillum sp. B39]